MIRSNDHVVREFVETYFNQAFRAYSEYQKQMGERFRHLQGVGGLFPPFDAWAQFATPPFAGPPGSKPPSPHQQAASPAPTPLEASDDLRNTVTELKQQLAAMRAEMNPRKAKRRKR